MLQTWLTWAGFRAVRPHMRVAADRVDVEAMLRDLLTDNVWSRAHGRPTAPSNPIELAHRARDLNALRTAHEAFLDIGEHTEPIPDDALPQLLLLADDRGRRLRSAPGPPAACFDDEWPAPRSAQTFSRLRGRLSPGAEKGIDQQLCPASG
ncbi:hypothetical protein OHS71_01275 [Streptomyces sp. NBC_00377]|uniref:hypothetical protein n=1 Tax=unclassified Streptomyces TaxID=2593676 RepID=UPI002E248ED2|nr:MULTISPECIES: hypothetical protein [unclassified Streptomyces]